MLKKCSRCRRRFTPLFFGLKRTREEYKTCVYCRKKQPLLDTEQFIFTDRDESSVSTDSEIPPETQVITPEPIQSETIVTLPTCSAAEIVKTLQSYNFGFQIYRNFLEFVVTHKEFEGEFYRRCKTDLLFYPLPYDINAPDEKRMRLIISLDGQSLIDYGIPLVNLFDGFVKDVKYPGKRRCDICYDKNFRRLKECYRCSKRCCDECYTKIRNTEHVVFVDIH
jgi:hypothetical protein